MAGTDIFISYSRQDRAAAKHFAECFGRQGFSVWWDAALRSGETFDEVIEKELRGARAVVVLWSPRSVASRWVRAEATLADRRNKLVPAIIEACDRPIIFELTHAADLADWSGDEADPVPADKPAKLDLLRGAARPSNVETLLFNPPHAAADDDEDDDDPGLTQFCANIDGFDLHRGDAFHCLEMIDAVGQQSRFVVSPLGLKIGRTKPADIVVHNSSVSRSHCLVELADERLRIADLNSTNGTYIDDQRVDRVGFLPVGSILRVGTVSFKHEVHSRAQLEPQIEPISIDHDARQRAARLARLS